MSTVEKMRPRLTPLTKHYRMENVQKANTLRMYWHTLKR